MVHHSFDITGAVLEGVEALRDGGSIELFVRMGSDRYRLRLMRDFGSQQNSDLNKFEVCLNDRASDNCNILDRSDIKGLKEVLKKNSSDVQKNLLDSLLGLDDTKIVEQSKTLNIFKLHDSEKNGRKN